jgi:hypothetical protein
MKTKFKILLTLVASACALVAFNANAGFTPLITGTAYTNATVGINGTNYQYGVVTGASTNVFNLATGVGVQGNTNLWPSVGLSLVGYPGTMYGPASTVSLATRVNVTATNATSTAIVFRYAGSNDGANWVTNLFSVTYTVPVNSTTAATPTIQTNYTSGAIAYLSLYSIENPGVAAVTNIVLTANSKPGL